MDVNMLYDEDSKLKHDDNSKNTSDFEEEDDEEEAEVQVHHQHIKKEVNLSLTPLWEYVVRVKDLPGNLLHYLDTPRLVLRFPSLIFTFGIKTGVQVDLTIF